MLAYLVRRILLMVPTLLGILLVSFAIAQVAPGGPVEQIVARLNGQDAGLRAGGGGGGDFSGGAAGAGAGADASGGRYRGSQGLDPAFIEQLRRHYGLDKPAHERFLLMLWNYAHLDFGKSFYRSAPVIQIIAEKLPVSITLGLWLTVLSYAISIPLGIRKAVRDGSRFDTWTSAVVIVGYAIPSFLFAVLLIVLFGAGSAFAPLFPLRGLTSDNWAQLPLLEKVGDYLWHIALPVTAMVLGSFATSTLLTKNAFLDEIRKAYVTTARMKGLSEQGILYGHVFRNAMLIMIAGFPGAFIGAFFAGSFLIETVFSLDGLGYLSVDSAIKRDFPVVFGSLFIFSLIGLTTNLLSDVTYTLVDPRIDFERRA